MGCYVLKNHFFSGVWMKTLLLWQFNFPKIDVWHRLQWGVPFVQHNFICFEVGITLWQKHEQSALFAFLFIQIGEGSGCWKTVTVCLCIVMRIHLLWYVTWPAQETDTEKGLRKTNQSMATVANFRLSGLDNAFISVIFIYIFIYAFVRSSGCVSYGRMPGFQSLNLASYVSPAEKYSECWSLPRISIYSSTAFWYLLWLCKKALWMTDKNLLERVCPQKSYYLA